MRTPVGGEWSPLRCITGKELRYPLNGVRVIKSRRMRWAGHVALMGERRGVYRVMVGKPEGKNHLGDLA